MQFRDLEIIEQEEQCTMLPVNICFEHFFVSFYIKCPVLSVYLMNNKIESFLCIIYTKFSYHSAAICIVCPGFLGELHDKKG